MGELSGLRADAGGRAAAGAAGHRADGACPAIAVIVPTLNERGNITALVAALDTALLGLAAEMVFVDDWSNDGTAEAIEAIARRRRDIRLVRRSNRRGLASAVVEGMLATVAPIVAVIDADLQHDPAILPALIAAVASGEADLAIGSRYDAGGSCGTWSHRRRRASKVATRLAYWSLAAPVSDPLSGFFAIRREIVTALAPTLSRKGFKILLDILASADRLTVREIPYVFRTRTHGASKLSGGVVYAYARLLLRHGVRRALRSAAAERAR